MNGLLITPEASVTPLVPANGRDFTLEELQKYARAHNIPDLAPAQLKAIQELKLQTGRKN